MSVRSLASVQSHAAELQKGGKRIQPHSPVVNPRDFVKLVDELERTVDARIRETVKEASQEVMDTFARGDDVVPAKKLDVAVSYGGWIDRDFNHFSPKEGPLEESGFTTNFATFLAAGDEIVRRLKSAGFKVSDSYEDHTLTLRIRIRLDEASP